MLNNCPKQLPSDINDAATNLARAYLKSDLRPRLDPKVLSHWDKLIDEWIKSKDLPLFIRKQSADIGDILHHRPTGRTLAPCDNSPAHWAILTAFQNGENYTLDDIRKSLDDHLIAVTMTMSKADVDASKMKGQLVKLGSANDKGWKVDHIENVGLKQRIRIQDMNISDLELHFRRLMSPSNIILVPSTLKGLGDMPMFITELKAE